ATAPPGTWLRAGCTSSPGRGCPRTVRWPPAGSRSPDAVASADVTTGTVRARTIGASAAAPGGFVDADASAGIEEALFLTPVDGAPSTPVPFAVFMDLDGILEVGGAGIETS